MATKRKATAAPRLPLTRDRVLRAALDLADRDGIESLSMRKLGRELGVEAMSLYNHVADKDDLLDGLADIVVSQIEVPSAGGDWRPTVRQWAVSSHTLLARHPWAGSLVLSRTSPSPVRSGYQEAVLGAFRGAGFDIELALHAFFLVDAYVYGFALQERNMPSGSPDQLAAAARSMQRLLPATEYPAINEVIVERVLTGFDYADEFEFGLDLILDALARSRGGD